MPAMIDTPARREYVETHAFNRERSQTHQARPGFWWTLAHGITTYLIPPPREWHVPSCHGRRPFETPMDRLAREYPSLSVYALALI